MSRSHHRILVMKLMPPFGVTRISTTVEDDELDCSASPPLAVAASATSDADVCIDEVVVASVLLGVDVSSDGSIATITLSL